MCNDPLVFQPDYCFSPRPFTLPVPAPALPSPPLPSPPLLYPPLPSTFSHFPSPRISHASFQLALACILLERAIRADRLSDGWHLWHRESEALACSTVAAVAVRVKALDAAVDYCRERMGKQGSGR